VFTGADGIKAALLAAGADVVVNGIAGAAGLEPSIAALNAGADLALANKESIVMGWHLVAAAAERAHRRVVPVDSEHSGVFSLLHAGGGTLEVSEVILTASGGPFVDWNAAQLEQATPADALHHPTWTMGRKITIDSASLANKGLEVIEASRLFNLPGERVRVAVHRQSVVHALVRAVDGSLHAELSRPDMRLPIHKALHYPAVAPCLFGRLESARTDATLSLTFEEPDGRRFPMLPLAYKALAAGPLYTVAYNAADEVAVERFLAGEIRFTDIARITAGVLAGDYAGEVDTLEAIWVADEKARKTARGLLRR
jgi:1-deoxy-D-xylulose-5-phosphate reductoisomerase